MKYIYIRMTSLFTAFAVGVLADYYARIKMNWTGTSLFLLNLAIIAAIFFVLWLILSLFWRKIFKDIDVDERIKTIESKSARNGYIAAFLGLTAGIDPIFSSSRNSSDSLLLFLIFAISLLTFIVSFIYFFHKES
jgi:uncharacterized membrane protein